MFKRIFNKKNIAIAVFVLMLLILPLTVYLAKQQQQTHSNASGNPLDTLSANDPVASYNGVSIYKKDLEAVAAEQYGSGPYDLQAYKDALNKIVERKVLDTEATAKGVSVSQDEIDSRANLENVSSDQAHYEILREKITMLDVNARRAVAIGFWSPPATDSDTSLTDAEKQTINTQLKDGLAALTDMQTGLAAEEDSTILADSLADAALSKYQALKPVLAVNGYIYDKLGDVEKQNLAIPQIYEYGASNFDQTVLDGLFAMGVNEVKTFTNSQTNQGGNVFKVLEIGNKSGPATYDLWLVQQESPDKFKNLFNL
jgi:hypothetical protein